MLYRFFLLINRSARKIVLRLFAQLRERENRDKVLITGRSMFLLQIFADRKGEEIGMVNRTAVEELVEESGVGGARRG